MKRSNKTERAKIKESIRIADVTIAHYNALKIVQYLQLDLSQFQGILSRALLEIERSQEILDEAITIKRDCEEKLRKLKAKKGRARDEKK